jgi:hypothetical protein
VDRHSIQLESLPNDALPGSKYGHHAITLIGVLSRHERERMSTDSQLFEAARGGVPIESVLPRLVGQDAQGERSSRDRRYKRGGSNTFDIAYAQVGEAFQKLSTQAEVGRQRVAGKLVTSRNVASRRPAGFPRL